MKQHVGIVVGLVLAVATLHLGAVFLASPVLPEDDAFITLRYADNLIRGEGFVFNPGERVLGTTSPAHAGVLAAIGLIAGPERLPAAMVVVNALWIFLAAAAALLLFRGLGLRQPIPELAAAWMLLSPQMIEMGLGGMESCLFAFVTIATLAAAAHRRWTAAALLAAVAVLVRPEGALLPAIAAFCWWRAGRPRPAIVASVFGSVVVGWTAVAWIYYGSPIPQSVLAKARAAGAVDPGSTAIRLAAEAGGWLFGGAVDAARIDFGVAEVAALLVTLLLIVATAVAVTRRYLAVEALLFPVWLIIVAGIYAAANPYWFPWYSMVVLVPWSLAFVVGLGSLDSVARRSARRWAAVPAGFLALLVVIRLIGAGAALVLPNWPAGSYGVSTPYRARILSYGEAARWLNGNAPAGAGVLSSEIGLLGYAYRRGPIVDAWGLVTPVAAESVSGDAVAGHRLGSIEPELVRALTPSFVASFPMFSDRIEVDPWFGRNYRLVGSFDVPHREYPQYRLGLFARRDLSAAVGVPTPP